MAVDPVRHARVVSMLREENLAAVICSAPTEVLLLTGYWPGMGNSIAIFAADGEAHVVILTDEDQIAVKSSNASLTEFSMQALSELSTVGFATANANRLPRIHPASPDVLEAGMTLNVEPAIYFEGYGGMRHCDMVAVTSRAAEVLTQFQTEEFRPAQYQGMA